MEQVLVRNRTRGTVVARQAGLAKDSWSRLRGLMGRRSLAPDEGLIIRPCSSIHTCFMRFPIDVLFVDESNRVLRAFSGLSAWRFGPVVRQASYVVELPAGTIFTSQTEPGDLLEWGPCPETYQPEH